MSRLGFSEYAGVVKTQSSRQHLPRQVNLPIPNSDPDAKALESGRPTNSQEQSLKRLGRSQNAAGSGYRGERKKPRNTNDQRLMRLIQFPIRSGVPKRKPCRRA